MSEDLAPPAKKSRQSTIQQAFSRQKNTNSTTTSSTETTEDLEALKSEAADSPDPTMAQAGTGSNRGGSAPPPEHAPLRSDDREPVFEDEDDLEDDGGRTLIDHSSRGDDFLGTPMEGLIKDTASSRNTKLPQVMRTSWHQVLYGLDSQRIKKYEDRWTDEYVKMPCSYKSSQRGGYSSQNVLRWNLIKDALSSRIRDARDLKEAILKYNPNQANRWDFGGLEDFFQRNYQISKKFFGNTLPEMIKLVEQTEDLFPEPPKLLKKGELPQMMSLTQKQAACLLCHGFFCTFPFRNSKSKAFDFPEVNFSGLFIGSSFRANTRAEKLKCLLHYFERVTNDMPKGNLTFKRQILKDAPKWESKGDKIGRLHLNARGTIEDDGKGMLQVDFANKYLGGGVLGRGCVQEEIRFIICPEMIISRLVTEALGDNECLIMTGCERFSNYTGYADTFKFDGDHDDKTPCDQWKRRLTEVVAIDARVFTHEYEKQFSPENVTRELNKAYCGFMKPRYDKDAKLPAVATGNWGCGAFGGDPQLKAVIQLMAAAVAERDVCFFTFNNHQLMDEIHEMHKFIQEKEIDVAELFAHTHGYHNYLKKSNQNGKSFYEYIKSKDDSSYISSSPDYRADTP